MAQFGLPNVSVAGPLVSPGAGGVYPALMPPIGGQEVSDQDVRIRPVLWNDVAI